MSPIDHKNKRLRYEHDPTLLSYYQLLEKLQQVLEEAGVAYSVEALSTDPDCVVGELEQSRSIELFGEDDGRLITDINLHR